MVKHIKLDTHILRTAHITVMGMGMLIMRNEDLRLTRHIPRVTSAGREGDQRVMVDEKSRLPL